MSQIPNRPGCVRRHRSSARSSECVAGKDDGPIEWDRVAPPTA